MPNNDIIFKRLQLARETELNEICKALKIGETKNLNKISKKYRSAAGHCIVSKLINIQLQYRKIYDRNKDIR